MDIVLAFGHVLGAIVAVVAFGFGVALLGAWELQRNQKAATEELSISLGIPAERLDAPENFNRLVQFAAARFSSDRFQNRVSDFCWWVQAAWNLLSSLLQIGVLLGVIWYSFTDGPSNAVYAWWVVAIAVAFWVVSVAFAFACKLLTGRFPGQAKQVRKTFAKLMQENQSASLVEAEG